MLASVQYMRAIAALMVVLFHVLTDMFGSGLAETDRHIRILSGGVDLFFVISGFVMFHATVGRPVNTWSFLQARWIRIAPLYILATLSMLGIEMLLGNPTPPLSDVACSLMFIPCTMADGSIQPVFNPGWTLNFEMFFYLTFACALVVRDWRFRIAAVATFLIALVALKPVLRPLGAGGATYANGLILEFLLGICVGVIYRKYGSRLPRPKMFIGVGLLLGIGLMETAGFAPPRMIFAALPATLILIGMLALDARIPRLPLLGTIGDASYSIYLVHPMIIDLVDYFMPLTSKPSFTVAVVAVVASACVGVAVHFLVEKPLTRLLRKRRVAAVSDGSVAAPVGA